MSNRIDTGAQYNILLYHLQFLSLKGSECSSLIQIMLAMLEKNILYSEMFVFYVL